MKSSISRKYKTNTLTAIIILLSLSACSDDKQKQSNQTKTTPSPAIKSKPTVSIDGDQFMVAQFRGTDDNGKKKEAYMLDLQDAGKVIVTNSFVYGKDTTNESEWLLLIGDNTPRIICKQKTKEAKMVIANMDKKISNATVEGEYSRFSDNKLYLENCSITSK